MKKKITYIAFDDTEFNSKEECEAYENSMAKANDYIHLYDRYGKRIEWNPNDYDSMWNHLYYIVIEPHKEEEAEKWWEDSFNKMLCIGSLSELTEDDWDNWKHQDHGDEPTILAFDFNYNDSWIIFNTLYKEVKEVAKRLNLVDALS